MRTDQPLLEAHQHQQAELPDPDECPHCGALGGKPLTIEDRDDSVGYHDIVQGCTLCIPLEIGHLGSASHQLSGEGTKGFGGQGRFRGGRVRGEQGCEVIDTRGSLGRQEASEYLVSEEIEQI
jgi:hypothetical protein